MSISYLQVGDFVVDRENPDLRTAKVYEVVSSNMTVMGDDVQQTVGLLPTYRSDRMRAVTVMAGRYIRVAGPVGGSRRPGEEPDIVY